MKIYKIYNAIFLLAAVLLSTVATAQDTSDGTSSSALEEVMVTATRRGESDIMSTDRKSVV